MISFVPRLLIGQVLADLSFAGMVFALANKDASGDESAEGEDGEAGETRQRKGFRDGVGETALAGAVRHAVAPVAIEVALLLMPIVNFFRRHFIVSLP